MVAQNTSPSLFADFVSGISLEKLAEIYFTTGIEILKWFQQPQIQELYHQFRRYQRAQQLITERQARIDAMKALSDFGAHPLPNADSVRAAASILRATSHLAANRPAKPRPRQMSEHRTSSVPHESVNSNPGQQTPDPSAASQPPRDPYSRIGQLDSNDLLVEFLPELLQSEMKRAQRANPPSGPSTDQSADQPITQSELSEPSAHETIPAQNSS